MKNVNGAGIEVTGAESKVNGAMIKMSRARSKVNGEWQN